MPDELKVKWGDVGGETHNGGVRAIEGTEANGGSIHLRAGQGNVTNGKIKLHDATTNLSSALITNELTQDREHKLPDVDGTLITREEVEALIAALNA
jgi:hypothetical protein